MQRIVFSLLVLTFACSIATAQQQQPQAPIPARNPFDVTPAEQAWLDQVLRKWETDSASVRNFYCKFERDEHNVFGPGNGGPAKKDKGELGYTRPDKGNFHVLESLVWTPTPQPVADPNQPQQPQQVKGEYKPRLDNAGEEIPGEHWVCDGQQVYEYKHEAKELRVRPIPPEMQGKQIVDGPLPFLFGAEADKIKKRFWIEPAKELCNQNFIGIHIKPKYQSDAAEYSDVWVVLRNMQGEPLMPAGLRVLRPNGRSWDEFRFDLANAKVNARMTEIFARLFQAPMKPIGWKRIDEPLQQAAAPVPGGGVQK